MQAPVAVRCFTNCYTLPLPFLYLYHCVEFYCNSFTGSLPQICDFYCPIVVILFFSGSRPGRTPGRILTVYGLNDASSLNDVPFGGLDDDHNFKGFKPPKKTQKRAMLGIFQPNWQNYKIAISPAGKIGSIPNFDRLIEPHS